MRTPLRAWIFVSLAAIAAAPAPAFDFIVTEYTDDPLTQEPGCTVDHCTLREAVIEANAGDDDDRILLSAGTYFLTLVGSAEHFAATGDLDLTQNVEILGAGATMTRIDATGLGETPITASGSATTVTSIRRLTIQNSSGLGLGLAIGNHTVEDCEIRNNGAGSSGSGIAVSIQSVATIRRTTITGSAGAGLLVNQGSATVESSTFSGNSQQELLVNFAVAFSCSHCTVSDPADAEPEVGVASSTATFTNSIVAGNCSLFTGGVISSSGGNVESPGNGCGFGQGTDLNTQSSGALDLAALADNGGPTRTQLTGAASVANDNGETCPQIADQRGVVRAAPCESGAVERTATALATPIFADGFLQGDTEAWSPVP